MNARTTTTALTERYKVGRKVLVNQSRAVNSLALSLTMFGCNAQLPFHIKFYIIPAILVHHASNCIDNIVEI